MASDGGKSPLWKQVMVIWYERDEYKNRFLFLRGKISLSLTLTLTLTLTQGLCQLGAGGCAGFIEVALMHPLDLVKTRFQVQVHFEYVTFPLDQWSLCSLETELWHGRIPSWQNANCSVLGSFRDVIRTEGAASLYKGILPALLQDTPKRATKFFCFEQYKGVRFRESVHC